MAGGTLRITRSDLAPDAVRTNQVDYLPGTTGYMLIDCGDTSIFLGTYDADCVMVARMFAAQLTKAADDLDALIAAKAQPAIAERGLIERATDDGSIGTGPAIPDEEAVS